MSKLRHSLRVTLAAGLILAATAAAQPYPVQQIRMVVGYGAGGGADSLIRALAPELSELLGQQIVVDNRPGGGSVIGTQIVAASRPDGYTLLIADNAYIVNPFLMSKLPYDSLRDFVPVALLSSSSTTLAVVHPSLPVKTVKELISLARARPGELNYASGGNGTLPHLMGGLLNSVAKINLVHIPYKSTALAIYAAASGEVTIAFGGIFAVKGLVEAGRLRALAIASAARNPLMPAVPTFAETGWPAVDATGYRGLLAPAGTPREIIARLNADANKAVQLPAVRARLTELGYDVLGGTPEDYGRVIRAEMEKWGKIIRDAGIKVQ
jgi:tripartite-type tricarboxylate transporter receptor subunit TctC